MQAMFIFSLFMFVMTLMAAIVTSGSTGSATLTDQRIADTRRFYEAVATVVKNDITQQYLTANPNNDKTAPAYIRNLPAAAAMSSGLYGDVGVDAWGNALRGAVVTEYQMLSSPSDPDSSISVPVTAVAFVSSGPDGTLQTAVPANPTTILAVRNIVAPTDAKGLPTSDDIVYTFDNRENQMRVMQTLQAHMERIGTAALKEYQGRVATFRAALVAKYQADVAAGKAVAPPSMDLADHGSAAPKMLSLSSAANRRQLGVDEDFSMLERTLPDGSKMLMTTVAPANPDDPLVMTLTNGTKKTPWGKTGAAFKYVLRVYPDKI